MQNGMPINLVAFKWAESLSQGEQSVLLSGSLKRLQSMINAATASAEGGERCGECGHVKLNPWRGYCQHEVSPFGKRPIRYCGCKCSFPVPVAEAEPQEGQDALAHPSTSDVSERERKRVRGVLDMLRRGPKTTACWCTGGFHSPPQHSVACKAARRLYEHLLIQVRAAQADVSERARRVTRRIINALPYEVAQHVNRGLLANIIAAEFNGGGETKQ